MFFWCESQTPLCVRCCTFAYNYHTLYVMQNYSRVCTWPHHVHLDVVWLAKAADSFPLRTGHNLQCFVCGWLTSFMWSSISWSSIDGLCRWSFPLVRRFLSQSFSWGLDPLHHGFNASKSRCSTCDPGHLPCHVASLTVPSTWCCSCDASSLLDEDPSVEPTRFRPIP